MVNVNYLMIFGHHIQQWQMVVVGGLLGRTNQNIRQNHLKEMVQKGSISMAFPHTPNSPKQGYTTKVK